MYEDISLHELLEKYPSLLNMQFSDVRSLNSSWKQALQSTSCT